MDARRRDGEKEEIVGERERERMKAGEKGRTREIEIEKEAVTNNDN